MVLKTRNSTSSRYTDKLLKKMKLDKANPQINKQRSERDRELYEKAVLSR